LEGLQGLRLCQAPTLAQVWHVPNVTADYFGNSSERWWNHPNHGGHGPFDQLTPPLANFLLGANASGSICNALTAFVHALLNDHRQ
jgi:hypothetical protein